MVEILLSHLTLQTQTRVQHVRVCPFNIVQNARLYCETHICPLFNIWVILVTVKRGDWDASGGITHSLVLNRVFRKNWNKTSSLSINEYVQERASQVAKSMLVHCTFFPNITVTEVPYSSSRNMSIVQYFRRELFSFLIQDLSSNIIQTFNNRGHCGTVQCSITASPISIFNHHFLAAR